MRLRICNSPPHFSVVNEHATNISKLPGDPPASGVKILKRGSVLVGPESNSEHTQSSSFNLIQSVGFEKSLSPDRSIDLNRPATPIPFFLNNRFEVLAQRKKNGPPKVGPAGSQLNNANYPHTRTHPTVPSRTISGSGGGSIPNFTK